MIKERVKELIKLREQKMAHLLKIVPLQASHSKEVGKGPFDNQGEMAVALT
ncbi:unnamed protein product [marine sediment metagenome]|uniref:Uncharacterized protein n=1 Tax=marine sediment metagenome TaxID=412755 RepID=X1G744_9ZZZZ